MYIVTQVFPNAIEIWDQVTKDEKTDPTGHLTLFIEGTHEFRIGDEVQVTVKPVREIQAPKIELTTNISYPGEPEGRSAVREYGTHRDLGKMEYDR